MNEDSRMTERNMRPNNRIKNLGSLGIHGVYPDVGMK